MRINSKITKRVNDSVAECRKCLIESTIELLKKIGVEDGQDVTFQKTLILFQQTANGTTETILVSHIAYCDYDRRNPFLMVSMGSDSHVPYKSSHFISLSNLQIIYDEVRSLVREH